ncbi:sensor histidine kinase [Dongia rigui]|uniref:Signal transduction histidine-protein kinase/phosphatase MprB n=1 Tax=Dongia rigui TaxID=940149 RepID=A0ABU5DTU5_9PROT|nr:HAMP domain-containing sensor histidine kinase [Dongia rigui]MDY0870735.1 HAMP domain-containing sensor histidine kinase [Dongia rigui]
MTDADVKLPTFGRGLSARVLVLTILFVLVSEVLIYAPSIARFRLDWLEEKLNTAHLAILALEATPDYMIDPELEVRLLNHVGARIIALRTGDGKNLILRGSTPSLLVDVTVDLGDRGFLPLLEDGFETLWQGRNRVMRVKGYSPRAADVVVDVVFDEWPLRQAMIAYSWRVLGFSIVISLITAALLFGALQWLIIRPMRRLTGGMVAFRQDPEAERGDFGETARGDEIGVAEREFGVMQDRVRQALQQRARLAALGTAVTKINHDLRGILATARLVTDRLAESDNPEVRKLAPALLRSLDRAVDLCSDTLNFTREGPPKPEFELFALKELVDEVGESLGKLLTEGKAWISDVADHQQIRADRGQVYRILRNLGENALQMGAKTVTLRAVEVAGVLEITIADDGPGLSRKALENLFVPFKGSARAGGTGLGLAIARELMRGQGGDLRLLETGAGGAVFSLTLPAAAQVN